MNDVEGLHRVHVDCKKIIRGDFVLLEINYLEILVADKCVRVPKSLHEGCVLTRIVRLSVCISAHSV